MMKFLLASLLLIALSACNSSEKNTAKDPAIAAQISKAGVYIPMTDEARLKPLLDKATKSIITYMDENGMNRSNYFLVDGEFRVSTDAKYILIPIRHYNSIAANYKSGRNMDEIIKKQQLSEQPNPDKTDGYLLLDNKTNQVDGFQSW